MVDFRRWFTAIAVLALFAGLASAQVNGPGSTGALQCSTAVSVTPTLRAEGYTEQIGDIVITCTGGVAAAQGALIPTANITISLGTNVTSRLVGGGGSGTVPSNTSEALLLIDEPGSSLSGPGPAATQTFCTNSAVGAGGGGCAVYNNNSNGGSACTTLTGGVCTTFGTPINAFQGLVSGNQVIFNGVPVNPPASAGFQRVYRITNVRANTSGLGGGGLAGTTQLLASISISGSTSLPITNPVQTAGFIQAGLSVATRNTGNSGGLSVPNFGQCGGSSSPVAVSVLNYSENFATAFKVRTAPTASTGGQAGAPPFQNIPGTIYNSESGFIVTGNTGVIGLADYGTRLKAVFNNVPSGVRIFVSATNITNTFLAGVANPGSMSTTVSFAQAVVNETAVDSNNSAPLLSSTGTVNSGANTINIIELPVVNNSATAVWEVINTNPSAIETFSFGVWQQFSPNPGANSPTPGTATVNMSFAPVPPAFFSASQGSAASGTLTIPRFADTSTAQNLFAVVLCQTTLLYPFVTNQGGFDTGLAIANTTTDPFGTRVQAGTCTLNWYGASAPPPTTTPSVATGTVFTTLASTAAPGFQGYMIAVCNFQLAHGFAFISDIGARNLAMGYLALVVPTGTGNRNNITEQLEN
jgi:hypothetical protein